MSKCLQPGEGPSRGRLRDCETDYETDGRCCTTAEQMREKVAGKPNKGRGTLKNVNWPQKVKLREARGG